MAPEGLTTWFPIASVPQEKLSRLKIALVPKNKNPKQARLMGFYILSHFTVVSDRGAGGSRTYSLKTRYIWRFKDLNFYAHRIGDFYKRIGFLLCI